MAYCTREEKLLEVLNGMACYYSAAGRDNSYKPSRKWQNAGMAQAFREVICMIEGDGFLESKYDLFIARGLADRYKKGGEC